jgi:hypothetical protein
MIPLIYVYLFITFVNLIANVHVTDVVVSEFDFAYI